MNMALPRAQLPEKISCGLDNLLVDEKITLEEFKIYRGKDRIVCLRMYDKCGPAGGTTGSRASS